MQRPRVASRYLDAAGPRVFAHRGFADGVPGNTLAAFGAALEAGATHLESDVRATRDGVPVLFHDECLPVGLVPAATVRGADGSGLPDDVDANADAREHMMGGSATDARCSVAKTDNAAVDGPAIRTLTLAELRRIDLGGGHRIPTVAEALDAFPGVFWNLDLKAPDAVVATAKQVWRVGAADRVLLRRSPRCRAPERCVSSRASPPPRPPWARPLSCSLP